MKRLAFFFSFVVIKFVESTLFETMIKRRKYFMIEIYVYVCIYIKEKRKIILKSEMVN